MARIATATKLYESLSDAPPEQIFWQGAGVYAPREIVQPWQHTEWHRVPHGRTAYGCGLGTPVELGAIPDGFCFVHVFM